jgi:tetratricopeptide (TPR) repeat protein
MKVTTSPIRIKSTSLASLTLVLILSPLTGVAQAVELGTPNLDEGVRFLSKGRIQEARQALLMAVEQNEPDPGLYSLLGQVLERTKEVDLAIEMLGLGTRRFPRALELYAELGHFCMIAGRFQEGIAAYEKAVDLSDGNRDDVLNLAVAYYRKGLEDLRGKRYFEGLMAAKSANQLVGNRDEFQHLLGSAYLALSQKLDAKKAFLKAIELSPENADYYYDLALTHMRLNEGREAEVLLSKAVGLNPNLAMAHVFLGRIAHNNKRNQEALDSFLRAREIDPTLKGLHYHIGFSYKAVGEDSRAVQEMEEEVRMHPDYVPALIELGDLYLRLGDGAGAARHLESAIRLAPSQARSHFLLGKARFEEGRLQESLLSFAEASRLNPSLAQVHYWRAQIHMKQGNRELAQNEIKLFQQKKAGQPDF